MLPIALGLASLIVLVSVALLVVRSRAEHAAPAAVEMEPPKQRSAVLREAVPPRATISGEVTRPKPKPPSVPESGDTLVTLDALLAELESATVRIDGADALDEGSVAELEGIADRLEAAAASLGPTLNP
jgi:hypothetical protein